MTLPVVAFLGLGRLGGPMCRALLDAGYEVHGYDPSPVATAAVEGDGAVIHPSPASAATGAEIVVVMVRDDAQALAAVLGSDDQPGVIDVLEPGARLVVHSTVSLHTVERLDAVARDHGVVLVDAGISGGPDRARDASLVAVCGGDPAAIDAIRPMLSAYASDVIACGPTGAGMAAKLVRNLAQYGVWCALFEGMELAARSGVELDVFAEYVRLSGLPSNHDVILGRGSVGPVDLADDDAERHLRWAVELGHKDLDDAFELADRLGVDTPIGRIARRRYRDAMGFGDR